MSELVSSSSILRPKAWKSMPSSIASIASIFTFGSLNSKVSDMVIAFLESSFVVIDDSRR